MIHRKKKKIPEWVFVLLWFAFRDDVFLLFLLNLPSCPIPSYSFPFLPLSSKAGQASSQRSQHPRTQFLHPSHTTHPIPPIPSSIFPPHSIPEGEQISATPTPETPCPNYVSMSIMPPTTLDSQCTCSESAVHPSDLRSGRDKLDIRNQSIEIQLAPGKKKKRITRETWGIQ